MANLTRNEAIELLSSPGSRLEVTTADIRGVDYQVPNADVKILHDLYASGAFNDDMTFLVYEDERYSYLDTYLKSANFAWRLQEQFGIKKGDSVAIASRNYPEWCLAFMAITSIGAIAVALNAWWNSDELKYGLQDSNARLVIADQERLERIRHLVPSLNIPVITIRPVKSGSNEEPDISTLLNGDKTAAPDVEILPDDDAMIMYTSGSTGKPKGVVSSHRAIMTPLFAWAYIGLIDLFTLLPKEDLEPFKQWLFKETDSLPTIDPDLDTNQPPPQESSILTYPMFHISGVVVQFLFSMLLSRKLVLMYKWNPEKALELIEQEHITVFEGVPTLSWELINSPDFEKRDTSTLQTLGAGGAKRPVEQAKQIQNKFKKDGANAGYGLTETNGLGTGISGGDYAQRPASVGRPTAPLLEVEIRDEQNNALPPNQDGEICIKSCALFRGYWKQPQATAEVLRGGWLYTGDIGHLDEEGFLYITDRAKDIVIRGGENISCAEVEEALYEHPAVFEAAVFGLPDERLGEILGATVMLRHDQTVEEDELKKYVESRIAKFKVPAMIWLQHNQLPRLATGKIDKRRLKQEAVSFIKT